MNSRSLDPLWGLPSVLPFESPASWLSRAAQAQGIGITVLLRHLDLRRGVDVDLVFLSGRFPRLAKACGLSTEAFSAARKVMASLRSLDPGEVAFCSGVGTWPAIGYARSASPHSAPHTSDCSAASKRGGSARSTGA